MICALNSSLLPIVLQMKIIIITESSATTCNIVKRLLQMCSLLFHTATFVRQLTIKHDKVYSICNLTACLCNSFEWDETSITTRRRRKLLSIREDYRWSRYSVESRISSRQHQSRNFGSNWILIAPLQSIFRLVNYVTNFRNYCAFFTSSSILMGPLKITIKGNR